MQHLSWGHLSISAISQLLQALFGLNFKQRVLGIHTTDYNCHQDICPTNICPYHQYLSCYCPNLDQILNKGFLGHIQQITTVTTIFVWATFVVGTFVHISNISISKLNTFDFSLDPLFKSVLLWLSLYDHELLCITMYDFEWLHASVRLCMIFY